MHYIASLYFYSTIALASNHCYDQLVVPKMFIAVHTSAVIKSGQWVIQVSDTDPVSTPLMTYEV